MTVDFDFNKPVTQNDVEALFRLFLARDVGNESYKQSIEGRQVSVRNYIRELMGSREFTQRFANRVGVDWPLSRGALSDELYRAPGELALQPDAIGKVLLIGSCLMEPWTEILNDYNARNGSGTVIDRINTNNGSRLPELDAAKAAAYDFQIVQVPLRAVMREAMYYGLRFSDCAAYQQLFEMVCRNIGFQLESSLDYNRKFGLTSFVLNFLPPQQNPMGRLQPRYALNNMVYFVEELNRHLWKLCQGYKNVHMVDFDQIIGTAGRRYFQDDSVSHYNHGSFMVPMRMRGDENRLEPLGDVFRLYAPRIAQGVTATYREVLAMYRSIRQQDSVKLVIFDLDDTLWRGIGAEVDDPGSAMAEGWPLGILEAVSYLWRRGVLVALASKNDEENVRRIWNKLYEKIFPLENFVVRKVNWQPKPQSIGEILQAVNLLPGNALFVDDNPVERAAVKSEFPDIRVLDAPLVAWRRILLWSPETQSAVVTDEAGARTEMIQAQIERDTDKVSMGREDFLASLDVRIALSAVRDQSDRKYDRCFELLNKTNQYNTTGKRWSPAEMQALLAGGGYMVAAEVTDRYTGYGIVGVAIISSAGIEQFVMSCRVFGMDVEMAILARTIEAMRKAGAGEIQARLAPTGKNKLCLTLYRDAGFTEQADGVWLLGPHGPPAVPPHIQVPPL